MLVMTGKPKREKPDRKYDQSSISISLESWDAIDRASAILGMGKKGIASSLLLWFASLSVGEQQFLLGRCDQEVAPTMARRLADRILEGTE